MGPEYIHSVKVVTFFLLQKKKSLPFKVNTIKKGLAHTTLVIIIVVRVL